MASDERHRQVLAQVIRCSKALIRGLAEARITYNQACFAMTCLEQNATRAADDRSINIELLAVQQP